MEFATKEKYKAYIYTYIDELRDRLQKGGLEPFEEGKLAGKIDGLNRVLALWDMEELEVRLNKAIATYVPGEGIEGYRRGTMAGRCEAYMEVSAQLSHGFGNKQFVADGLVAGNNGIVAPFDPSVLETEIYIGGL